jgi:diaminobutyrate-2-oxoglutarate transaminase
MHNIADKEAHLRTFDVLESRVRNYSRAFPVIFETAVGSELRDEAGKTYIDFFSGAGALNFGHNNPLLKQALVRYIQDDGITHGLDMVTSAKRTFLEDFHRIILGSRGLTYRVQFTGPTGANVVEAALKIARKVTGRSNIVALTNGFHGMSQGVLSVTGHRDYRLIPGIAGQHVTFMPFDGYHGPKIDTLTLIERYFEDPGSGIDKPAAFIIETVQGEGGLNVASIAWLQGLATIAHRLGVLLIVDDIQTGCGRAGTLLSFEPAGLCPDIVTLLKSLSGFGLPLAVALVPELDVWAPGEHSGTLRGNNLAFVTASEAIRHYWSDDRLAQEVETKVRALRTCLDRIQRLLPDHAGRTQPARGRGLLLGLDTGATGLAVAIARAAFRHGLVVEACGADNQILKCMPPLTIDSPALRVGMDILEQAAHDVLNGDVRCAGTLAVAKAG